MATVVTKYFMKLIQCATINIFSKVTQMVHLKSLCNKLNWPYLHTQVNKIILLYNHTKTSIFSMMKGDVKLQ